MTTFTDNKCFRTLNVERRRYFDYGVTWGSKLEVLSGLKFFSCSTINTSYSSVEFLETYLRDWTSSHGLALNETVCYA